MTDEPAIVPALIGRMSDFNRMRGQVRWWRISARASSISIPALVGGGDVEMTPDDFRGGYAAVLMIGRGTSALSDVPGTIRWHQQNGCWISSSASTKLYEGMPVVARMAGESNELLMLGVISDAWRPNEVEHESRWPHLLPVAWEAHVTRGVYAADVIGKWGKARPAAMTISKRAWREIVHAMLA